MLNPKKSSTSVCFEMEVRFQLNPELAFEETQPSQVFLVLLPTTISLYLGRNHVFQIINSIKGSAAFIQVAIQNKCIMLFLQLSSTMYFPFLNSNYPKREGRYSFVVMSLCPLSLFSSKQDFFAAEELKSGTLCISIIARLLKLSM